MERKVRKVEWLKVNFLPLSHILAYLFSTEEG